MIGRALVFVFVVALGVDGSPWSTPYVTTGVLPATRVTTVQATPPPDTTPAPVWPEMPGPCSEWAPMAFGVGWPVHEWPTLSRVMWCESRCNPAARNPSGASGLLQVMPMHWAGRDPFDPAANLTMGLEVHERQGWRAWSCY